MYDGLLLVFVGFEDSGYTGSGIRRRIMLALQQNILASNCTATYHLEALHYWS